MASMRQLSGDANTENFRRELEERSARKSPVPKEHSSRKRLAKSVSKEEDANGSSWCTDEFLQEIPKADIHVHLDGSLRLDTLIELARATPGLDLPSEDLVELKKSVFRPDFKNLEEYLMPFAYTVGVMQNYENLERIAYEFAVDNFSEGVRYFEVRFAPQLHCSVDPNLNFGILQVFQAVYAGVSRAREEFNENLRAERLEGLRSGEPHYDFGIIACAMRMFFPGMSRYYDALFALHPHASAREVTSMASINLVLAAKEARDAHGIPIVAIDVAGAEKDNEAAVHAEAFRLAHRMQFGKTVHAGEGYGPESIWQAVRDLHAERIGHGFHIFSPQLVGDMKNKDEKGSGQAFVDSLVKYVSDRRITLEVCLTSNLNTMPDLALEDHALRKMVAGRLSVCLNTDNRLVSNTNMVKELKLAVKTFGLSPKQLREIVITGFKRSFYHGPYTERREYVRQVMNYYDDVASKHGVSEA